MSILTNIRMWLRALFQRGGVERELDREMQFHLEMEIEQNVRNGMSLAEARRRASLAFGGVERHKEAARDERGTRWIEDFVSDTRHAWRFFSSRRAFTAAAVLTLAIGIGAATAVYSLANWVLLRPVPGVASPTRVVRLDLHSSDSAKGWIQPSGISYPNLKDVEAAAPALIGLAASARNTVHMSADNVVAASAEGAVVAGDYFGILGVKPRLGRFFFQNELLPTSEAFVTVISDQLWRTRFNAEPTIVGRKIRVNNTTFDVIGVAPAGFRGIERVGTVDLWFPPSIYATLRHMPLNVADRSRTLFFDIIGRLATGQTAAAAQEQVRQALTKLAFDYPQENGILKEKEVHLAADLGIVSYGRRSVAETMRLLGIIVTIVLLISCANAANLLLLRGVGRRGETAVRRALGASAGRLMRQHFTEGLVLSAIACAAGILMSFVVRAVLREQSLLSFPTIAEMPIDPRIFVFALGLSLAVGVLFSLIPGVSAVRSDFISYLKESTRSATGSGLVLRRMLTVVQISAATALVVAGLLLGETLLALGRVNVGIDTDGIVSFLVDPQPEGYDQQRIAQFRERLGTALAAIPGVESSSIASHAPFGRGNFRVDLRSSDYTGSDWPVVALAYAVGDSYFKTLGIPLLVGQPPAQTAGTTAAPTQVVVSRGLAQRLFGDRDPIGRTIIERGYRTSVQRVVVGVAGDVRVSSLRDDPDLILYSPASGGHSAAGVTIGIVRSRLPATEIERQARAAVASIDPAVPVLRASILSDDVNRSIAVERMFGRLIAMLAILGALLAAGGLYGVIAYSVAERTREIGLRMALGATAERVIALVGRQALALVGVGIALGVVVALWLSRLLASKLFGVTPLDPTAYIGGSVVLLVVGAIAASVPARSATRVNPVEALRHN